MTFSFDEYIKNNKGALVKNDATKPVNPVDDGETEKGGDADSQRDKVNKSLEKDDASHGEKATVVKESDDGDEDDKDDEKDELNEGKNEYSASAKAVYEKNKSKKVGENFEDIGKDKDKTGVIIVNKGGTLVVAYDEWDLELIIIDNTYKYSEMISVSPAGKAALKKLL